MYDQEQQHKHGYIGNLVQWTVVMQMHGQALDNQHDSMTN